MQLRAHACLVACLLISAVVGAVAVTSETPVAKTRPLAFPFSVNFKPQDTWAPEAVFGVFVFLFLINIWRGRQSNERRAIFWATQLISAESQLPDNFALIGPGNSGEGEVLVRESMNIYCVHVSGRRYCKSGRLTFFFRKRQDLLAWAVSGITRSPDVLDIQIDLSPGSIPPLVLLIARAGHAKTLAKEQADVKTFTKLLEVKKDRLAAWPSIDLAVYAEQASAFYDLMTPYLLSHSFGQGAWEELGTCFRHLHITSEGQGDDTKQFINLSLELSEERQSRKVLEWLRAVIILIDSLGTFKFTPEQAKRAAENRAKKEVLALKAAEQKRQEELMARREKKAEQDQEKLRRMTPQQREKELERRERIRQRRGMKSMMRKG
ncbi:hypothetical protein ACKKBF_B15970 [Auxenochlorella protothecoides x Auxenochlorella symbiontica]